MPPNAGLRSRTALLCETHVQGRVTGDHGNGIDRCVLALNDSHRNNPGTWHITAYWLRSVEWTDVRYTAIRGHLVGFAASGLLLLAGLFGGVRLVCDVNERNPIMECQHEWQEGLTTVTDMTQKDARFNRWTCIYRLSSVSNFPLDIRGRVGWL